MPVQRLPHVLRDLLTLPTATFREDAVRAYVEQACRQLRGVTCRPDRHGNLLACYRHRPPKRTPLVFAAHMDHPSFVAQEMTGKRLLRADFRGGVLPEYFPGSKVRFWTDDGPVRGTVVEITGFDPPRRRRGVVSRPKEAILRVPRAIAPDTIGMWDLPDPALRGGLVRARGCDDIVGCAAMLALLERLSRKQARAEAYALFTRAEEVGFIGAIGAARARTVPKRLPIIAIEASSELPTAKIGDGPILRVGDRAAVFTPALTAFCDDVAKQLAARRKRFAYQRKLMDGGTCESTAYMSYGYAATGICLALGNYHNMDRDRGKIASETIALDDYQRMVDWFEALVLAEPGYVGKDEGLRRRLESRFAEFEAMLR